MESTFWLFITHNPTQVLNWLVFVVGIFLSILHNRRNPKKSILTLIAFVFFLLESIGSVLLLLGIPNFGSAEQQEQYYFTFRWIEAVLWFAAWTAMFFALFRQESSPSETS
jgi:hypothetical protein